MKGVTEELYFGYKVSIFGESGLERKFVPGIEGWNGNGNGNGINFLFRF